MAAVAAQPHGFNTPDHQLHTEQSNAQIQPAGNAATPVWSNPNPPLPRGRAPRDPSAVTTKMQCQSLQDMETKLRDYLDDLPAAPEHCTAELTLWAGAAFLVKLDFVPPNLRARQMQQDQQQADAGMLQAIADFNSDRQAQQLGAGGREISMSVLDALQQLNDPKETMKRQRAISKVCVAAVQRTDGFRYSFHNSWKSGEDNAYRFSYYCNDSLLNKDRVANGKSGSQGKRATKPVFDCKGVLSVKFSATRQCIDVVYKHIPCHETYENRAPPPRKNSKRRAEWEQKNPDRVKALKDGETSQNETPSRDPKKKKKKEGPPKSAEAELREQSMFSLLELMRPEEAQRREEAPQPAAVAVPQTPTAPSAQTAKPTQKRQPKAATSCAICLSRRTRCDGGKPRCKTCGEKSWPCFYQTEQPPASTKTTGKGQPAVDSPTTQDALPGVKIAQQTNDLYASNLASQNETLQKELSDMRQEQQNNLKETNELKAQLAEMKKHLDSMRTEKTRLATPQPTPNMNMSHDRRTGSQHHLPSVQTSQQQPGYSPGTPQYLSNAQQAPQYQNNTQTTPQYQTSAQHLQSSGHHLRNPNTHLQGNTSHLSNNTQHLYHQTAATQATHRPNPVYQTNDRAQTQTNNAWGSGLYGAYQPNSQPGNGIMGNGHMMGGYR